MASGVLVWISCLLFCSIMAVSAQISDSCVHCLCEAVSGRPSCLLSGRCVNGVCGPYAITFPYWQDAGSPTVGYDDQNSTKAFEKCTLDATCAESTIRGYMTKFNQDCNGDKVVNCWDYAAIHFHGGYGCHKPLSVPATNALRNCLVDEEPPPAPPVDVVPSIPDNNEDPDQNVIVFPNNKPTTDSSPFQFKFDSEPLQNR